MKENKLGTLISTLRKEKNLTQKDLADILNVSDKAVSRWETGGSSPSMDMIFRISKYFKISYNDLLAARVVEGEDGDEIVHELIEEFQEINKRKSKILRIVLIAAFFVVLALTITMIFTKSYNRFKVYNVGFVNNDFVPNVGVYVETKIKDSLHLGDIKIKGYEVKTTDTISVDLYFVEDNKEYIIQSYSSLNDINFVNYQSYIEIDDLSEYIEKLYLKVRIIDAKGNQKVYDTKVNFTLDFSNNKIFYKEDNNPSYYSKSAININKDEVKAILINHGFEETKSNNLIKKTKKLTINYLLDSNKIFFNYENNKLSYRYTYYLETNILEVLVFDENNTEIESYKYDSKNNKVIECKTGSCNDYKVAMELLNNNILNLIYQE